MDLEKILTQAVEQKASDVHLVYGIPPTMRVDGEIITMSQDKLRVEDVRDMVLVKLDDEQLSKFHDEKDINVSFAIAGLSHFRMNIYLRNSNVEAAIRVIPFQIPTLEDLDLPPVLSDLTRKPYGIILITGPAGMGKTTTLSAMIDLVNSDERRKRIITIEDPIEYKHEHRNSVIIQREVGRDTLSFHAGLKEALRQDPNWICIGEMRDLDTISTALTAAETGHLVLATLHSPDTVLTVSRIVDAFPKGQQNAVCQQLGAVIQGIISQRLVPRMDGNGRVLAHEMLVGNIAVRNIIRSGQFNNLNSFLGPPTEDGAVSLDYSLAELYCKGIISYDVALSTAKDTKSFMDFINFVNPPMPEPYDEDKDDSY